MTIIIVALRESRERERERERERWKLYEKPLVEGLQVVDGIRELTLRVCIWVRCSLSNSLGWRANPRLSRVQRKTRTLKKRNLSKEVVGVAIVYILSYYVAIILICALLGSFLTLIFIGLLVIDANQNHAIDHQFFGVTHFNIYKRIKFTWGPFFFFSHKRD